MTLDLFDKASDLRIEINHLHEFEGVLANCKGHRLVAENVLFSENLLAGPDGRIINSVQVRDPDKGLVDKLLAVVREEIRAKEAEFRSL